MTAASSRVGPLEVVLVRRRVQGRPARVLFATALLTFVLNTLLGGLALMLLVPLASETLGTPSAAPGYWPCVALVFLARSVLVVLLARPVTPEASR